MTMNDLDAFPQSNGSQIRKECEKVRQGGRRGYCGKWYVVHFETGGQPPNAHPVWGVTMGYDDDLCGDDEDIVG